MRWLRLGMIGLLILLFASIGVLTIEYVTSSRTSNAVSMIRDPNGDFGRRHGEVGSLALVGSTTKTLTVANVTRGCGRNSFLVFSATGAIWVDVYFQMSPNQGSWAIYELTTGLRTKPKNVCSLA